MFVTHHSAYLWNHDGDVPEEDPVVCCQKEVLRSFCEETLKTKEANDVIT